MTDHDNVLYQTGLYSTALGDDVYHFPTRYRIDFGSLFSKGDGLLQRTLETASTVFPVVKTSTKMMTRRRRRRHRFGSWRKCEGKHAHPAGSLRFYTSFRCQRGAHSVSRVVIFQGEVPKISHERIRKTFTLDAANTWFAFLLRCLTPNGSGNWFPSSWRVPFPLFPSFSGEHIFIWVSRAID